MPGGVGGIFLGGVEGFVEGEGMAEKLRIKVNGRVHSVAASPNTPLLYVLRNELRLNGPRFGCGLAQCGSCSVLLNGKEIRACITPVAAVTKGRVTTLEGLAGLWKQRGGRTTTGGRHGAAPRAAGVDRRAGAAVRLLPERDDDQGDGAAERVQRPTEDQIKSHMNTHLCRCGTYPRVTKAINRAAKTMAKGA